MESALFLAGSLSLLFWGYLLFLRGGFWRAEPQLAAGRHQPADWPAVAALQLCGDDPDAIEDTLPAILTQDYPGPFHIVLVVAPGRDDCVEAARRAARTAGVPERLTLLRAEAAPPGWSHRAWSLAQAQEQAAAHLPTLRYLWLTEPWLGHERHSLRDLVAHADGERCDLVSPLPGWESDSLLVRVLGATLAFLFQAFQPLSRVNDPAHPAAVAVPGCVLVASDALRAADGFAALKDTSALEYGLSVRVKAAARQRGRGIWLGLAEDCGTVRPGDEGRMARALARTLAATPDYGSPLRLAGAVAGLTLACVVPPVVFLWALFAGFFLEIDQFLITFLALLVSCGASAAMVFAAWPTFDHHDQEEWHTLLLPLAAMVEIPLLLAAWAAGRAGAAPRRKAAPATAKTTATAPAADVKIEPRLEVPVARVDTPPAKKPPAAAPRATAPTASGGHALRRRIARS